MFIHPEFLFSILGAMVAQVIGLPLYFIKRNARKLDEKEARIKELEAQASPHLQELVDQLNKEMESVKAENQNLKRKLRSSKKAAEQHVLVKEELSKAKSVANHNYRIASQRKQRIGELERARSEHSKQLELARQEKDGEWETVLENQKEAWNKEVTQQESQIRALKAKLGEKEQELASKNQSIEELTQETDALRSRIDDTLGKEGRVWERPVREDAVTFIPLSNRQAPIISVLNFKGGVGKSTITANLAAVLADKYEKKTLVIDLDYQRNLTKMCCGRLQLQDLHLSQRCIQHILLSGDLDPASSELSHTRQLSQNLRNSSDWVRRKEKESLFRILACSDNRLENKVSGTLDDTEMHLLAQWLLNEPVPDVRLRLREALHYQPVQKEFDYILLDCPPRLSVGCMNAIAASDFVLIPVLLDKTSTISAPQLLSKITRLQNVARLISPQITFGIVANKVMYETGTALQKEQRKAWDQLPLLFTESWGKAPTRFKTFIQYSTRYATVANGSDVDFAACKYQDIRDLFGKLAEEIVEVINNARENSPALSS